MARPPRHGRADGSARKPPRQRLPAEGDWSESVRAILDFQREDGSFSFVSDCGIPSDARVLYLYRPSYACCQILMRTIGHGRGNEEVESAPARGLAFCCTRDLFGHGHSSLSQQIEDALNFIGCGALALADAHPELSPEFFSLLQNIGASYAQSISLCKVFGGFGDLHAPGMTTVAKAMEHDAKLPVFVYGTLLTDMPNAHLIEESELVGSAFITGYRMYDLGLFPSIRPSRKTKHQEGIVHGEVRLVDAETLKALNHPKNEGRLYRAESVAANVDGRNIEAPAYVYLHRVRRASDDTRKRQPQSEHPAAQHGAVRLARVSPTRIQACRWPRRAFLTKPPYPVSPNRRPARTTARDTR